jgi:hypothetical protein
MCYSMCDVRTYHSDTMYQELTNTLAIRYTKLKLLADVDFSCQPPQKLLTLPVIVLVHVITSL